MNQFANPQNILITGASSGIGAALALVYAKPGNKLHLGGRDASRLDTVAEYVRKSGADCDTKVVNVTDRESMHDWIHPISELDLVIANAGISVSTRKQGYAVEIADADVFATNVNGVVNTVAPAISHMHERGQGQIALMSSLASFRAFREAPAYCASKAAVRFYGTGLRRANTDEGIGISVICPGFVRSPMTDANTFKMPMIMDAEVAAALIQRKLARNRPMIAFPLRIYFAMRILALF
ncbi:MAG: SDR family NAD(P)-dependent oxidoreductase [Alphaproteobacteria bacterium]|jgi:NADP-dependent 3-hydroxy acid dehydrogenase YdfG|nr:SDR family NAD(P)-dependent oxidoreductase [Alphaproteobacteria bacterium]